MPKKINKFCCVLMVLVTLALTVYPAAAEETTMQGVFGDDLTWRYTPSDKTLTVKGRGEMPSRLLWEFDYYGTLSPWGARGIAQKIERVVIREGVTAVGSAMFQHCTALRQVQLPNSLRSIGSNAFAHTALTEIRIPRNVEYICDSAFADCEELRSVTFAGRRSVQIGAYVFGCTPFLDEAQFDENGLLIRSGHLLTVKTDLQGVCTVPEGVKDIADCAFTDYVPECSMDGVQITKVVFPKSLQYIGSFAFYNCEKLAEAEFKADNVRFGCCAFEGTALPEKEMEKVNTGWCDDASDAPAPTEIRIGISDKEYAMHSYEKDPDECWRQYDRLQSYVVHPLNPYYKSVDGVLYSKDGRILLRYPACRTEDTFTVPRGVKVIGAFAFSRYDVRDQVGLRKVILPEGVTVIRECAFDDCTNLEEVVLPSTLKTIDACAFSGNTSLKTLELPDGLQEVGECFLNDSQVTHVRFPDSMECFHGGSFNNSALQVLEGFDRIPYVTEYGMEAGSFCGTPFYVESYTCPVMETESEEEPETDTETDEYEEPVETETYGTTLMILNGDLEETAEEHIKVGLFKRYKSSQVQLNMYCDMSPDTRLSWSSDNKKVTVDENGLVTNRLHRRGTAMITLTAESPDGSVWYAQVRLYFYRFDFQLQRMQNPQSWDVV